MSSEEIMEIWKRFDLTGSLRGSAQLASSDHKTVAHYVALRDAGKMPDDRVQGPMLIDEYLHKVEELIDRSEARSAPTSCTTSCTAMGFSGSERTTRRAVARARRRGGPGIGGSSDPGFRSRGCGCKSAAAAGCAGRTARSGRRP